MRQRNFIPCIFGKTFLVLLLAFVLAVACEKVPEPLEGEPEVPSESLYSTQPLSFDVPQVAEQTKAPQTNTAIGPTYNLDESFKVFAAYSATVPFTPSDPYSFMDYWDASGLTCSYNAYYRGWVPSTPYYWPKAGYLSFRAYSPADGHTPSFSWEDGFTYTDFVNPDAGSQYDILYSGLVTDRQRSDYPITDGNSYDDDPDQVYIYKGVNLDFYHALSLVEVQAYSSLGSYSSVKYYIQSAKLCNVYKKGTFTSSNGAWVVDYSDTYKISYTLLDLSTEPNPEDLWKVVPGADDAAQSIHPKVILMPLPQELNRTSDPDFSESVDAYLEIVYKCNTDDVSHTTRLPLTGNWERSKKYIYKLVFSADIEFTASISSWDTDITYGSYLIVQ